MKYLSTEVRAEVDRMVFGVILIRAQPPPLNRHNFSLFFIIWSLQHVPLFLPTSLLVSNSNNVAPTRFSICCIHIYIDYYFHETK